MIPQEITATQILRAAREIDQAPPRPSRASVYYDVIINGKRYPPKYVISIAAKDVINRELLSTEFDAAEARKFFVNREFRVVDRRAISQDQIAEEDEENTYPEGAEAYRYHRQLERNSAIARDAKAKRSQAAGALACDVCGFDFSVTYGSRGIGYIEAHHKVPLAQNKGSIIHTKIEDLALVCANCHRMLHRGGAMLSIEELRKLIAAQPMD